MGRNSVVFRVLVVTFLVIMTVILVLLRVFVLPNVAITNIKKFLFTTNNLFCTCSIDAPVNGMALTMSSLIFTTSFV